MVDFRNIFKGPVIPSKLTWKRIISLITLLFALYTLPMAVYLVQERQIIQKKAASAPVSSPLPSPSPRLSPVPTVKPELRPPSVTITYPLDGARIKRTSRIFIVATAEDNVGVAKVDFFVNGKLRCTTTFSPYTCEYRLTGKPNAVYLIQATAYDIVGNHASHTIRIYSLR